GEVRRLVANCWRRLLNEQGLPYAHLSYGPAGTPGWFGFRVDSDFGNTANILKTVDLARETGIRMSWFLNARAIEPDLSELLEAGLRDQDVQLHCFDHRVYSNLEENRANIERGVGVLTRNGVAPVGAASPWGDWNESWQQALERAGLEYSSDFAAGYDDLPFRPLVGGHPSATLQVPCHPVSPGRLRACRARPEDITTYFADRVELCCCRHEPALFYGHPDPVAELSDVMAEVLRSAARRCGGTLTWTDYARWWRERELVEARARYGDDSLEIDCRPGGERQMMVFELPGRRAELAARPGRLSLAGLPWQDSEPARLDPVRLLAARRRGWQARFRQWLRDRRRQT
ncbi:hypothetical protein JXB37_00290, partial [candidate division WOR-3 bacterium]|nr:hypothetical protein [candidate division WOR-3 bacterium]